MNKKKEEEAGRQAHRQTAYTHRKTRGRQIGFW